MFKKLFSIVLLVMSSVAYSQIPTYYNDVNLNLTGTALRDELATKVINTHTTTLSYDWTVIQQTDLDPNDNSKVLLIYGSNDSDGNYVTDKTRSVNSNGGTAGTHWNREHTYAKSLGTPDLGTSGPGADVHHLRASDITINGNRGSLLFASGSGVAGTSGSGWYPGDEWKGDVARMMMYMYLRYGTRCLPSNVAIGTTNTVDANMIDLLVAWNAEDPVSTYETNRNTILETAQGNRNPFIDNPAFATTIWGGAQAEDKFSGTSAEKEINIQGNLVSIVNGSTTTTTSNDSDFGSIDTASGTVVKTFTIQNTGGTTLTLSGNPSISTNNASDFSVTTNPANLLLTAGSSTTFQVTFDPSADGIRTTTVTISSDDADEGTYTFNISGTGTTSGSGGSCGSETFDNNNASASSYTDNSFVGDNSVTWGYVQSRNVITDSNNSGISLPALLLRNSSSGSKVSSSSVSGGIGDFSVKLYKGFTSAGTRQVELFVNGVSKGVSTGFDDFNEHVFSVPGINLTGNVVIELVNTTSKQIIVDDVTWTCYSGGSPQEINVQGNAVSIVNGSTTTTITNNTDFGSTDISSGSLVKTFTIQNLGGTDLILSSTPIISTGDFSYFTVTSSPNLVVASNGSTTFDVTFNPNTVGLKTTTVSIFSDDSDEGTYTFNITGTGIDDGGVCETVNGAILFQQGFEAVPATPTLAYTATKASSSTGNGNTPSDAMFSEGTQGLQINNTGLIIPAIIEFEAFDSTSYSNLEFSIRLASFSGTSGNGSDSTDSVKIFISTDDGVSYSEEINLSGGTTTGSNNRWSFTSGTGEVSVVYDGDNVVTSSVPSGSGDLTTEGVSTLRVTNLPSSATLRIKVELMNDKTDEFWVIDNAKVIGDYVSTTTWSGVWSNNSPANNVKVVLDSDYDMTSLPSIETCECEVKSGKTLTVSSGKYLRVGNNIVNNGTINVESGGSVVQVLPTGTNSGSDYTVERETTSQSSRHVFTYWSTPLATETFAAVAADAHLYYSFDAASQNWIQGNSGTSMAPGISYALEGPNAGATYPGVQTASFTGAPFNTGDISVLLSFSSDGDPNNDWNLLGNPYPSAISADAFLEDNSATTGGSIYFWTHNTPEDGVGDNTEDDYAMYTYGTGGTVAVTGGIEPDGNIASGQGFFAQALYNGVVNNIFTNSMRISGSNTSFFKSEKAVDEERDRVWLNLTADKSFSQILVGFFDEATDEFDRKYDGVRFEGKTSLNFYSLIDDEKYGIQGLSKMKKDNFIPLGFSTDKTGSFKIAIDKKEGELINSKIFILDKLLDIKTEINESDYEFTLSESGAYNDRFVLVIENNEKALSVKDQDVSTGVVIENFNNDLVIKTSDRTLIKKVSIYNILGKEIITKEASSVEVQLTSKGLKSNAILIVKTMLDNGSVIVNKIYKN